MQNQPIKVLCVDDNYLVAEGIRIKLGLEGGFEWLGQLPDADHLRDEVERRRPNIVLLDLDMPGKDAFAAMRELHESHREVRVIVISGHVRTELVDRAIEAGAWGYVSKSDGTDAIVSAIRQVMSGEIVVGPDVHAGHQRR